eukprot:gb/GFBE01067238.1/.p1 GENE.gb/GFBE01067238.1/~~gb/GFBE01067238.1/.p1  ORF type:complete len:424 (+),score=95.83 gb/GFBE01067238.1/:1-1272(+)
MAGNRGSCRILSDATSTMTLQSRYKVCLNEKLGEGGFAKLYKGLDLHEAKQVAVKIFNEPDSEKECPVLLGRLRQSVDVMEKINQASGKGLADEALKPSPSHRRASFSTQVLKASLTKDLSGVAEESEVQRLFESIDLTKCFVQLLGYSHNCFGSPDLDTEIDRMFIVTELGQDSLAEYLDKKRSLGQMLSVEELRYLHWSLVAMVSGLHMAGFVHFDIKPDNIIKVGGEWKLIDFDGAVETQSKVDIRDLLVTPIYMAPEVARALQEGGQACTSFQASRKMDVWSVGICALEAIFLSPVLDPWFQEWGGDAGAGSGFYRWLADYETEHIISGDMEDALRDMHQELPGMLRDMLVKDPEGRAGLDDCIMHPWFRPIRQQLVEAAGLRVHRSEPPPRRRSLLGTSLKQMSEGAASAKGKACAVM